MCAGTHLKTKVAVGYIKVLQLFIPFVAASILGKADICVPSPPWGCHTFRYTWNTPESLRDD